MNAVSTNSDVMISVSGLTKSFDDVAVLKGIDPSGLDSSEIIKAALKRLAR